MLALPTLRKLPPRLVVITLKQQPTKAPISLGLHLGAVHLEGVLDLAAGDLHPGGDAFNFQQPAHDREAVGSWSFRLPIVPSIALAIGLSPELT